MKEFRKADASRKLLRYVEERANTTSLDQFMAVYAFRTLQRMNRNDLCVDMIPLWHRALKASGAGGAVDVDSAAALLRACCKLQRMDLAEGIATRAGVVLEQLRTEDGISIGSGSSGGSGSSSSSGGGEGAGAGSDTTTAPGSDETPLISDGQRHAYGRFLPELALGYASAGSHPKALSALRMMRKFHVPIDADLSKQIFKGFLRESGGPEVRQCLRALLSVGGLGDNDSIQLLTSTYMKTVDFVKGAVSMETLPPATCPEAAFIGRSNVGKSSLINMLSNRKVVYAPRLFRKTRCCTVPHSHGLLGQGLAFTSKTPGKTSEFNYFDAQGRLAATNEKHRFYLVDLPGVGYAEVQRELKDSWLRLLKSYVVGRPTLRVLFHLIDSRHGLLDADDDCLSLLDGLPDHVQYVLVLTKVDKRGGGVRQDILDRVAAAVRARTSRPVPIVHTSSETREGGAEMWSILVDAVAGEPSANFFSNKYV